MNSTPTSPLPINSNAATPRLHLLGESADSLAAWLLERGEQRYRARQVLQWVYDRRAESFDQMSNLSKALRATLHEHASVYTLAVEGQRESNDATRKLLLRAPDDALIETVWIPSDDRNTVCISSQVGCPVGCRFCASGVDGLQRNLSAGEIVEQALQVSNLIRSAQGEQARLSNIVMMGMGEPLANYRNLIAALRILNADWGLNIGARKITVSTVGLPKQIRQLADEQLQFNLALSLHAVDDALRTELIPWGKGVKIADLVAACRYYFDTTGREITLEYVLLADVNMAARDANGLARIARQLRANVNLLRYNPVPGLPYERPDSESSYAFQNQLRDKGVNAHIRTSRGRDVDAACGQLRRSRREAG